MGENKIAVLVLAFNRADHVREAMEAVKAYKPKRLYLECDGARLHKQGEKEAVEATRKAMLDAVDWSCEVKTLFRDENLGCANAVYDAINWFFKHEEYGIIIEDDVLLSQDFFRMCEVLLPKYKDEDRVMQITSQNYRNPPVDSSSEYSFELKPFIWGWATWRRAWCKYMDMNMKLWPKFRIFSLYKYYGLFQTLMYLKYWREVYRDLKNCTSWATRWHFAACANGLLCICPKVNLGLNIGCVGEGTHYSSDDVNPYTYLKIGKLQFPLIHPAKMEYDMEQLRIDNQDFKRLRILGLKKKISDCSKKLV